MTTAVIVATYEKYMLKRVFNGSHRGIRPDGCVSWASGGGSVLPEKESDVKGPVVKEGMHEAGVAGGVQEGTQRKTRTETRVGTNTCLTNNGKTRNPDVYLRMIMLAIV